MRVRSALLGLAVAVAFGLGSVSAQGVPSGAFVKDTAGRIWLVLNGQRSEVPLYEATDEQISAFPITGKYVVPTGDGQGVTLGDRPSWLPGASSSSGPSSSDGGDARPTVELIVSDDRIDAFTNIDVTVIGRDDKGLARVELEGTIIKDNDDNDNKVTGDPVLDERYRFSCDDKKECSKTWTIAPTKPGRYTLRARARDNNDQRSDWAKVELRVREGAAPKPTTGPTPAPTSGPAPASR
ncbi:MAG: hypothetical protein U0821_18375 [Chloroflexota bacterium]